MLEMDSGAKEWNEPGRQKIVRQESWQSAKHSKAILWLTSDLKKERIINNCEFSAEVRHTLPRRQQLHVTSMQQPNTASRTPLRRTFKIRTVKGHSHIENRMRREGSESARQAENSAMEKRSIIIISVSENPSRKWDSRDLRLPAPVSVVLKK